MDSPISINSSLDDERIPLFKHIVINNYNKNNNSTDDSSDPLIAGECDIKKERGGALGDKSITQWGSFIFIVNQIYGPGVLSIPVVFQQSGWVLTLFSLTFFLLVSCLASTLLCDALSMIPGNRNFDKHIEYSVAVKYYFASIVICAQSLDQFFVFIFKKTFALTLHPRFEFLSCTNVDELYTTGVICISLGYLIICAMSIPTSMMNLNDNVKIVQTLSFIFLFILIGEFVVQYFLNGIELDRVPAFGKSYYQLVSIFVFSWAYPMFIPSWVNEKTNNVSVNKAVWYSGLFSYIGYIFIGLLGALAYSSLGSDNILNLMGQETSPILTRVASFLFSLGVIMPGIPVCFITIRYNLYVGNICGKKASYFWGVIAPWVIAFIFCQKEVFAQLLDWSSLILNSLVNFIIPFALYLRATSPKFKNAHNNNDNIGIGLVNPNYESVVQPYPKCLEKYSRLITWLVLISIITISVVQIIYDIIKAAKGYNPLN